MNATWGIKVNARSFKVQGRVTEDIINKMEQARILNPDYNESLQVSIALEKMYNLREKTSKFENIVATSMTKSTIIDAQMLLNRVNMRSLVSEMYDLIEILTLKIRNYPKSDDNSKDLRDLARLIYDIKTYSDVYYEIAYDTTLRLLKKSQKRIFKEQIESCIRVPPVSCIIGGTLDTQQDNISELVTNCMTVPINHREFKIDEALHYIAQNHEDATNSSQAFLNAIERAERKKSEAKI